MRKAGTVILLISIALWALASYPKSDLPNDALTSSDPAQTENLARRHQLSQSAAGRLGRLIEPAIRPLGFNWQIGVGILSSFAAREVIVSTLAIVYGVGGEAASDEPRTLHETLRAAKRSDGTPVFGLATSLSLLVFYILAMQCVPTLVVVRRETGGWRWPLFQIAYMTVLAYTASLFTYQLTSFLASR